MSVMGSNNLPKGFEPGPNHVIIGRGKMNFNHTGNLELRRIVASRLEEYSATTTKSEKSKIIGSVLEEISKRDPPGGFVKQDEKSSEWFDVGEFMSKDKISQTFRDLLRGDYKSSNEYKKKRRRHENQKLRQQNALNNANNAANEHLNNLDHRLNHLNQLSSQSFLRSNLSQNNPNLNQLNHLNSLGLQKNLEPDQLVHTQLQHLKQLKQQQQQIEQQSSNLNLNMNQHQQLQSLTDQHRRMSLQGVNNNGESLLKRHKIVNSNTSSLINLPLELNQSISAPESKLQQQLEARTLLPTTTLSMQNVNSDQQISATFLENMWNSRYLDLLDFHKQFGNCNVPISYKNQALVNWVIDQRHQHKCLLDGKPSTLSKARIDLLNSVGFNWKNNSPIGAMLNSSNGNLEHHRRMSLQNTIANKNPLHMMDQHRRMSLQNIENNRLQQMMNNHRRMSLQNSVSECNENPLQQMMNNRRMSLQNSVSECNENPLQQMMNNRRMSLQNTLSDNHENQLQQMMNKHGIGLQNAITDSNENQLQQMMNNRRMSLQSVGTDSNENQLQQMMNNRRMSLQNAIINSNENSLQQMTNNRRMSLPNILQNSISMSNSANPSMTNNKKDSTNSSPTLQEQKSENDDSIDVSSTSSTLENKKKKKKVLSNNDNDGDGPSSNDASTAFVTSSTISDSCSNKSSESGPDDISDCDMNDLDKNSSDSSNLKNLEAPPQDEDTWMKRFEELKLYVKENGNCCVPQKYSKNPKLGDWAEYERKQRKKITSSSASSPDTSNLDKTAKKRMDLLDSIGFEWDSEEVKWRTELSFLKKIEQQHKKKRLSKNADHHSKFKELKSNLVKQYLNYYEGRSTSLASKQIVELEKLGFSRFLQKA